MNLRLVTLCAALVPLSAFAQDGQHDFDFEYGHWHIHLKQLQHPLTGSKTWVEFDGTSVTRPIWQGHGDIEQFETTSPSGHIEGLTLRTFNPHTNQWRLYWANSKNGIVVVPQIGQFTNGVGEFYAQDTLNGKSIFIRFIWSKTNTNTPHFEQAFSEDGGKTWEVNWITDQTRLPESADVSPVAATADYSHDFDFLFGTRHYHLKRLSGTSWVESDGISIGSKIWGGRANITETQANGLMGLTLRTYNPETHVWYLYWANSRDGILSDPQIGQFKNGVGAFYATDSQGSIVRYLWSGLHFEQALSPDGGKTWDANWISSIE